MAESVYALRQTRGKSMDEKLLKKGIKYVVKIGRNRVAVRLIQKNADGVSYLVRNLKTLKPFFVKSAKSFADFQNEDERTKALKAIEDENAPIAVGEASKLSKEPKVSNVSKISNEAKVAKNPKIMGFGKCAFVKALGRMGYDCVRARKVLEHFGVEMPEKSLKIQLYFGRNEKFWGKFGKPAVLTKEKIHFTVNTVPL